MIVYLIYNLIYQVLSIGFLFFANTYLNGLLIPNYFKFKDGQFRDDLFLFSAAQLIILLIEACVLYCILRIINQRYLATSGIENTGEVLNWTSGIFIVVTLAFIIYLSYLIQSG